MAKSPILFIQLAVPDAPESSHLDASSSWLLSGVSSYNDYKVYAFGVAGLKKDPSLGRLFPNLKPRADGTFELELGVTLPDFLPTLNGHLDFVAEVALDDDDRRQVAISNQMVRLDFTKDGTGYHVICPRTGLEALKTDETFKIPADASPQLLRTTVTARFSVAGRDAEEALQEHVQDCIEKFISVLNRLLASSQMLAAHMHVQFSTSYEVTSFPYLYLIVAGDEPNKFGHGKLATHAGKVALVPPDLKDQDADKLVSYLQGAEPLNAITQMIAAAKSSFESGLLRFSLLQMVIAAEMATSQYVRSRFLALGVSRGKWNDVETDITYSQMLNVHLFAVTPAHLKPDRNLLGLMNRARDCRNHFMHRGDFHLKRDETLELLTATENYLRYIARLGEDRQQEGKARS